MSTAHDSHEHHAPAEPGVDRDAIDYAIRSDLPADAVSLAEQRGVFGFTALLSWLVMIAGIAVGGWLLLRANQEPSFFRYFGAFIAALAGVLWGSAITSVSKTGRQVIDHSAPPA